MGCYLDPAKYVKGCFHWCSGGLGSSSQSLDLKLLEVTELSFKQR